MAPQQDDPKAVYRRIEAKLNRDLSSEERVAFYKATANMSLYFKAGGLLGFAGGIYAARARPRVPGNPRMALGRYFTLTFLGVFLGTGIGSVIGSLSAVRTIRKLPNPEHMLAVFRECEQEIREERLPESSRKALDESRRAHREAANTPTGSFSKDQDERPADRFSSPEVSPQRANEMVSDEEVARETRRGRDPGVFASDQRPPQPTQAPPSVWDRIRRQQFGGQQAASQPSGDDDPFGTSAEPSTNPRDFADKFERERRGGEPGEPTDDTTFATDAPVGSGRRVNQYGDEV